MLFAAGILGLLLIAVVVNRILHSDENPFNPIAEAAVRTQAQPGASYSMVVLYGSPSSQRTVVARGGGVYNSRTGRSRVTLTMDLGLRKERIASVGDRRTVYLRSRSISAGLPPGRRWFGMQPLLGHSQQAASVGDQNAADQLAVLRAVSSDVESLGAAQVRGVATERYRGTVELDHYAELLREQGKAGIARLYSKVAKLMPTPIEIEVWIDQGGMVRRMREVTVAPITSGGPLLRTDMRIDIVRFGVTPKVKLPAPGEVFDSTPLSRFELGLVDGESAARMVAPTGAPLSPSAFRHRAGAVCGDLERRLGRLRRKAAPAFAELERYAGEGGPSAHSSRQTRRVFQSISISYFEPALAQLERGFTRLGRLNPPSSRAAAFRHYMRHAAVYVELDLAETRAAELGNLKLAKRISDRLRPLTPKFARATRAAGLPPVCAPHDEPSSPPPATPS